MERNDLILCKKELKVICNYTMKMFQNKKVRADTGLKRDSPENKNEYSISVKKCAKLPKTRCKS